MPIAEGIAAARLAMDAGSKALDLLRHPKIDGDAVRTRITEMQDLVFSAQRALGEAEEENRSLKRALDEQNRHREIQADLEMDQVGHYFLRKSEKIQGLIPYCPTCWGNNDKLVPLILHHRPGLFRCAIHDIYFESAEYLEHKRQENEAAKQRSHRRPGSAWS